MLGELMKESGDIPRDKMREIVADLGAMGVKAVTFSGGGEPLLYPFFVETVEGLAEQKIKTAALTNGSLLAGDAARILGRCATWVRISMDAANPKEYARVRQVDEGEFDKVCRNIARFAESKSAGCVLGVNFIVTRENHESVFAFLQLMKNLGVDHVKISEAVVGLGRAENEKYVAPFFPSVKKQIAKGAALLADDGFAIIDKVLDCSAEDSRDTSYEKSYRRCPFIQCLTVIAADLNIYTCQDKAYTGGGLLGSIRDRSFREVWFDKTTWERLRNLDPCRECAHHCVAHEKNLALLDYLNTDPEHLEFV